MNMTNDQFKAVERALNLYNRLVDFDQLPSYQQDVIIEADVALVALLKKKKRDNARTAAYIAEKRKSDKNYARSKGANNETQRAV